MFFVMRGGGERGVSQGTFMSISHALYSHRATKTANKNSLLKSSLYAWRGPYCGLYCHLGVDKRILVWDLAEGTLATELKGHTDTVYSLRFSRDGNMLASGLIIFFHTECDVT